MSCESVTLSYPSSRKRSADSPDSASDLLRTQVARQLCDIPFTPDEWNHLAERSPTSTIFQTYEWFECWWDSFGRDGDLLLISVFQGDSLLGFAPLMRGKVVGRRPGVLNFVADTHSDYLDFISGIHSSVVIRQVVNYLYHHESSWTELHLRNIPCSSPTVSLIETHFSDSQRLLLRGTDMACFSLQIEGRKDNVRRRVNKYSLRRANNYFQRQGTLEVKTIDTVSEGLDLLSAFFNQHIQRWESSDTPSLFHDERNRYFYKQLVSQLLPCGWLHLSSATLNERPIAFHFGFNYGESITWYKPSFDPGFAPHSPGKIILRHLMQCSLDGNYKELDFTIGAEPFKERYCDIERVNIQYHIFFSRFYYLKASLLDRVYRSTRWILRRLGLASWLRKRLPS